ncbi:hypothetical protein [Streptomyces scabiei]|uniref:hypothetical protein n=1 Tax=Streptomyces scabiei TaxID=1930 RepID=UPI0004E6A529|nr:hypothetical protein [Streptomyces scabiei]KFG07492.1 hypothetical protein IQ61_19000 [Streptomyces scabiei]MDX3679487.1 hypothetical protein [Streptomyces scabiei]
MSDALEKAARDAVEAADNTELVRAIAAVIAAQQMHQPQQKPAPAPVQRPYGAYVAAGIGGAVALTFLAMAAALLAVAVAVGAVAATVCVLVLRSMWQDMQKGH